MPLHQVAANTMGRTSCEIVKSLSPNTINGFNKEPAFFIVGHGFHTTTGLRVLQPAIARNENLWIEIKQLAGGHYFFRAVNGDRYEQFLDSRTTGRPVGARVLQLRS